MRSRVCHRWLKFRLDPLGIGSHVYLCFRSRTPCWCLKKSMALARPHRPVTHSDLESQASLRINTFWELVDMDLTLHFYRSITQESRGVTLLLSKFDRLSSPTLISPFSNPTPRSLNFPVIHTYCCRWFIFCYRIRRGYIRQLESIPQDLTKEYCHPTPVTAPWNYGS